MNVKSNEKAIQEQSYHIDAIYRLFPIDMCPILR